MSLPHTIQHFFPRISPTNVSILLTGLVVYALLHQLYLRPLFFSPLRKLPGPGLGNLLFGQFAKIVYGEVGIPQRDWADKLGTVLRPIGPFGVEHLIFLSPSALRRILVSHAMDYPRADWWSKVLGYSAGHGLLTTTGTEHAQIRRAMNAGFAVPNLIAQTQMYYPPIEAMVDIVHERIASQQDPTKGIEMVMYEWVSKVTLDTICATTLGHRTDTVRNHKDKLAQAYETLASLQSGPNMARLIAGVTLPGGPRFLRTEFAYKYRWMFRGPLLAFALTQTSGACRELIGAMHYIRNFANSVVTDKLSKIDDEDAMSEGDIMTLLIKARAEAKDGDYKLTNEYLAEHVLSFLGAGHTTIASGVCWALWLLANDFETQEKLRAEVTPLISRTGGRPTFLELKECRWLDLVVKETLRLYPSIPMVMRKAGKDDWIDGVFVPKDTQIYIPIRVVNTWSQVWGKDADEFRPERWLNLPPGFNTTFSYLSFTAGKHGCVGRVLGTMQVKAILAVFITHFVFAPARKGQVVKTTAGITMKPEDNLPLRITAVGNLPASEDSNKI